MEKISKKVIALGSAALVIAAGLGAGITYLVQPEPVVIEKNVTVEKNITVEVPGPVQYVENKTVETVYVDNDKLDDVLQHIYDNNGNVEYLTEDLDDDEVAMIADRVTFIDESKVLALDLLKKDLLDELDNTVVNSTELDDKDIERVRYNDDSDEIVVSDIDFEDKDATVTVSGSFEQDDVKYVYEAEVSIKDGEADEISSLDVEEA